ncbi:MAG: kinase [Clostridiales bacterium GWC2_40_7]|nr:MAG: kinase [Clostridiales bacterium GWC2_40_7]
MIISRTPYRISFFGGGTDYPAWYEENGGAVLATAIDKYCYITCRYLPPFFEHKSRIVYSQTELVNDVDEIRHLSVRETLKFMGVDQGVEIHHDGDLPSRSGLGTSSSFTVGLLNALYALKGSMPTKMQLALEAVNIEQKRIHESVGSQDQVMAAFGGLNRVDFDRNGFQVNPVILGGERLNDFQGCLMLFFTGLSRTASQIAKNQIMAINDKKHELSEMYQMVGEGIKILNSGADLDDFGRLLHESWKLKRSLTSRISSLYIDYIYDSARDAGAVGGKILGAGGGGFILFFVKPELQDKVKERLNSLLYVPFRFENSGSRIIYYSGV